MSNKIFTKSMKVILFDIEGECKIILLSTGL